MEFFFPLLAFADDQQYAYNFDLYNSSSTTEAVHFTIVLTCVDGESCGQQQIYNKNVSTSDFVGKLLSIEYNEVVVTVTEVVDGQQQSTSYNCEAPITFVDMDDSSPNMLYKIQANFTNGGVSIKNESQNNKTISSCSLD